MASSQRQGSAWDATRSQRGRDHALELRSNPQATRQGCLLPPLADARAGTNLGASGRTTRSEGEGGVVPTVQFNRVGAPWVAQLFPSVILSALSHFMGGGVIGSTAGFGPVRAGSSPAPPAHTTRKAELPIHVLILAAGQGKRMKSELPKVAHTAAGRSLIGWVMEAVLPAKPDSIAVVVGHGADQVTPLLPEMASVAVQEVQLGTGHATEVGLSALDGVADDDTIVVLYGDMPLLTDDLVGSLATRPPDVSVVMVTANVDDPSGYGRVVRLGGQVVAIVEDGDCTDEQKAITEINAGVYSFRAADLVSSLKSIESDNAQGERYLTDVIGILYERGAKLSTVTADAQEVVGINSQDQLSDARELLQQRINREHMERGVSIIDPRSTYIDDTVTIEPGASIYPGVHLEGKTTVGADSQVGPDVFAVDSSIGKGALVWYSVLRSASVGEDCQVGPYASLRPGTVLERGSKAGTFVETKNTTFREGAKAPHLSYLGDATVGRRANIGAGTITCNFDGYEKHATVIGDEAFIGSDTMLVAPISVGDRAITGAGSVITKDIEADALAVERNEQRIIPGYAQRRAERQAAKKDEES